MATLEAQLTDAFATSGLAVDELARELVAALSAAAIAVSPPLMRLLHARVEQASEDQLWVINVTLDLYERIVSVESGLHDRFDSIEALLSGPSYGGRTEGFTTWPAEWCLPLVPEHDCGRDELLGYPGPAVGSRDDLVGELCELLTADEQIDVITVTGDAFRGKTTIAAEVARRLASDESVRLLVAMNVRSAHSPPPWPVQCLNSQLLRLVDGAGGLAPDRPSLVEQFRSLLVAATDDGAPLVIIVDALDEAPDPKLLLEAIASRPRGACRLLVTTRRIPGLDAAIVPSPEIRAMELAPTPEAVARRTEADRWVRLIANSVDENVLEIFAALVVAGTGLSRDELVDLLGLHRSDVNRVLDDESTASWVSSGGRSGRVRLGHDYLYLALRDELGSREVAKTARRLERWAERYRELGWPTDTPRFLLEDVAHVGGLGPEKSDQGYRVSVDRLRDPAWVGRADAELGPEFVDGLTSVTLDETMDRYQGTPEAFELAFDIACLRMRRVAAVAIEWRVTTAHAALGELDVAEDLARQAAGAGQLFPLLMLAAHPNVPEHRRRVLAAHARDRADRRKDSHWLLEAYYLCDAFCSVGDFDEARQVLSRMDSSWRVRALVRLLSDGHHDFLDDALRELAATDPWHRAPLAQAVGRVLVRRDRVDEALELWANQPEPDRDKVGLSVIRELADAGHVDSAAREVELLGGVERHHALVHLATHGRPELFTSVWTEAGALPIYERNKLRREVLAGLARNGSVEQALGLFRDAQQDGGSPPLGALADALVSMGHPDEAEALLTDADLEDRLPILRALALCGRPGVITEAARVAPGSSHHRSTSVTEIVEALHAGGHLSDERHAREAREVLDELDHYSRTRVLIALAMSGDATALAEIPTREPAPVMGELLERIALVLAAAGREQLIARLLDLANPSYKTRLQAIRAQTGNAEALEHCLTAGDLGPSSLLRVLDGLITQGDLDRARDQVIRLSEGGTSKARALALLASAGDLDAQAELLTVSATMSTIDRVSILSTVTAMRQTILGGAMEALPQLAASERVCVLTVAAGLDFTDAVASLRALVDELPPGDRRLALLVLGRCGDRSCLDLVLNQCGGLSSPDAAETRRAVAEALVSLGLPDEALEIAERLTYLQRLRVLESAYRKTTSHASRDPELLLRLDGDLITTIGSAGPFG